MLLIRWLLQAVLGWGRRQHAYRLQLTPVQATCTELLVGVWTCQCCGHQKSVVYQGLR